MDDYQIIEKKISKNYIYYILEKNQIRYFAKQLKENDVNNRENFVNEINKYQCIKDLNFIAKIIDVKDNTIIYEYIEGKRLDKCKTLTIKETIDVLIDLASILENLHKRRIVHCDIKPSNILITSTHKIKLLDFGNSRFINEKTHYCTIRYASINQIHLEKVNTTFDIYSIGIIMYEYVTGKKAYSNLNRQELIKEKEKMNLKATDIVINLPRLTDDIIQKAIGKNKIQMYIDVKDLKKDLLILKKQLN